MFGLEEELQWEIRKLRMQLAIMIVAVVVLGMALVYQVLQEGNPYDNTLRSPQHKSTSCVPD